MWTFACAYTYLTSYNTINIYNCIHIKVEVESFTITFPYVQTDIILTKVSDKPAETVYDASHAKCTRTDLKFSSRAEKKR